MAYEREPFIKKQGRKKETTVLRVVREEEQCIPVD